MLKLIGSTRKPRRLKGQDFNPNRLDAVRILREGTKPGRLEPFKPRLGSVLFDCRLQSPARKKLTTSAMMFAFLLSFPNIDRTTKTPVLRSRTQNCACYGFDSGSKVGNRQRSTGTFRPDLSEQRTTVHSLSLYATKRGMPLRVP